MLSTKVDAERTKLATKLTTRAAVVSLSLGVPSSVYSIVGFHLVCIFFLLNSYACWS